jgi:hypothetical protein
VDRIRNLDMGTEDKTRLEKWVAVTASELQ